MPSEGKVPMGNEPGGFGPASPTNLYGGGGLGYRLNWPTGAGAFQRHSEMEVSDDPAPDR